MPPKRDASQTVRLSFDEQEVLRRCAHDWDMEISDVLRTCIAIAIPLMRDVEFARRIRLEDNVAMRKKQ